MASNVKAFANALIAAIHTMNNQRKVACSAQIADVGGTEKLPMKNGFPVLISLANGSRNVPVCVTDQAVVNSASVFVAAIHITKRILSQKGQQQLQKAVAQGGELTPTLIKGRGG